MIQTTELDHSHLIFFKVHNLFLGIKHIFHNMVMKIGMKIYFHQSFGVINVSVFPHSPQMLWHSFIFRHSVVDLMIGIVLILSIGTFLMLLTDILIVLFLLGQISQWAPHVERADRILAVISYLSALWLTETGNDLQNTHPFRDYYHVLSLWGDVAFGFSAMISVSI